MFPWSIMKANEDWYYTIKAWYDLLHNQVDSVFMKYLFLLDAVLRGIQKSCSCSSFFLLAHLNRRLKWAFLIKKCPASVMLCVLSIIYILDFISRTTGAISTKFTIKHPLFTEVPSILARGDNKNSWKFVDIFQRSSQQPLNQKILNYIESLITYCRFKFFHFMTPGGHNRG